jgi:hypothetical protein
MAGEDSSDNSNSSITVFRLGVSAEADTPVVAFFYLAPNLLIIKRPKVRSST